MRNLVLIIICNLFIYLIMAFIFLYFYRRTTQKSIMHYSNKEEINRIDNKIKELEKKIFIQDMLNHVNL